METKAISPEEIRQNFNKTIGEWEQAVAAFPRDKFHAAPAEGKWSMAQLCGHIVHSAQRIFTVLDKCLASEDNAEQPMAPQGDGAFKINGLGNARVANPAHRESPPPVIESPDKARSEIRAVASTYLQYLDKVKASNSRGRQPHPVMGHLDAREWMQSVEMHFRHHLRQKNEILEKVC